MAAVVVDPNVLVSGLMGSGPPAEVVDLVRYGELSLVVTDHENQPRNDIVPTHALLHGDR